MPKTRLYIQRYKSIGFVDAGACEGADIVLAKRKEPSDVAKAVPTDAMAKNAERALGWREEFKRGGTAVGVARARDIANKRDLSDETIGRMVSFFARHEVDKQAQGFSQGENGFPSAGRIAWDLWGGDEGQTWASREYARIAAAKLDAVAKMYGDERARTFAELEHDHEVREMLEDDIERLSQSVWSIYGDPTPDLDMAGRVALYRQTFDQFLAAINGRSEQAEKAGRKMAGPRLTKLREVVSQLSALLAEVDDESTDDGGGKDTSMSKKFDPSTLSEEARAYVAGIEKAAEERAAELETSKAKVAELEAQVAAKSADPEDAFKSLPVEVRKRIEDAEKAAEEAQKAAAAERDARVTAEWVQKAAPLAEGLPVDAQALGTILKRADENALTDSDRAELLRVLKSASEAIRVGKLFAEVGKTDQGGSAADKIQKLAEEHAAKNRVSLAVARTEVRKSNPELAAAEQAERKA